LIKIQSFPVFTQKEIGQLVYTKTNKKAAPKSGFFVFATTNA